MNRSVTRLLAAALLISSASVFAAAETNRTFINVRDFRNRTENLTTFHRALGMESDDRIGGNIEIVPFWRQTRNSSEEELGKGFGVDNLNAFKLTEDSTVVSTGNDVSGVLTAAPAGNVALGWIIHAMEQNPLNPQNTTSVAAAVTRAQAGDITAIKPQDRSYGANLNYVHKLDDLTEGLWFSICSGLVKNERKMDPEFGTSVTPETKYHTAADVTWTGVDTESNTVTIDKFLDGTGANEGAAAIANLHLRSNLQAKLTHGKIDTETRDESGVSDVELCLGWDFVQRDNARIGVSIGGVIPTGKESTAEFAFEPQYGSRHFQFGAGLYGSADLYEDEGNGMSVVFDGTYRYGFERTVKRLAGLKDKNFGHYWLLRKATHAIDESLIPAANVLAMDMKVKPGSMFDGTAMLCLHSSDFSLDLGYNIYATQSQKPSVVSWDDAAYFIAGKNYNTHRASGNVAVAADNDPAQDITGDVALTSSMFDLNIDSSVTHRGVVALGYVGSEMEYPVTVGIGGSMEYVQGSARQITPTNYEIWGKLGVSF